MLHRSVSLPVARNFYPGAAPITPPLSPTNCDDRDAIVVDVEPRYSGPSDTLDTDCHFADYFPPPAVNPKFHMQDQDLAAPSTQYGTILKRFETECLDNLQPLRLADFEVRGILGTYCCYSAIAQTTDSLALRNRNVREGAARAPSFLGCRGRRSKSFRT